MGRSAGGPSIRKGVIMLHLRCLNRVGLALLSVAMPYCAASAQEGPHRPPIEVPIQCPVVATHVSNGGTFHGAKCNSPDNCFCHATVCLGKYYSGASCQPLTPSVTATDISNELGYTVTWSASGLPVSSTIIANLAGLSGRPTFDVGGGTVPNTGILSGGGGFLCESNVASPNVVVQLTDPSNNNNPVATSNPMYFSCSPAGPG
jgi:hypothetical protein